MSEKVQQQQQQQQQSNGEDKRFYDLLKNTQRNSSDEVETLINFCHLNFKIEDKS